MIPDGGELCLLFKNKELLLNRVISSPEISARFFGLTFACLFFSDFIRRRIALMITFPLFSVFL